MIEALDYFVQKAAHNEALSNRDGDTAGAQIEKLVFINLAGSRSVGATDVVGENFQAGHRVHFCVVTQQKVTNFLIRGHEALPGSVRRKWCGRDRRVRFCTGDRSRYAVRCGLATCEYRNAPCLASSVRIGSANAAVLPLPVCAVPIKSLPARIIGKARSWIASARRTPSPGSRARLLAKVQFH
jgi:hypothetical protein